MVDDEYIKDFLFLAFQKQVVVAAVRSSNKARLAGAVYIYNLNWINLYNNKKNKK